MEGKHLRERYRIPTSGARAVESFRAGGHDLLAIPQLSRDAPGTPPGMNGGDSDTDLLLLRRETGGYAEHQTLFAPGGEDAEFFVIDDQAFLAVASIRSGKGPYEYAVDSVVHRWDGAEFTPFQVFPTFAAKQWRHFTLGGRHFLALAQGVSLPQYVASNRPSVIFEWSGEKFEPFQEIESAWAYNWHFFELDGHFFLAHADHVQPSRLYRWDGERFVHHQDLVDQGGRAFATFEADGRTYLACAVIEADSVVHQWNGERFVHHHDLPGAGAREFAVIARDTGLYLVRVNFIVGGRENPVTAVDSQLYRWDDSRLVEVERFPTTGGTDATVHHDGETLLVAVSNSLTADVRFAAETVVYEFTD
ncbi:hypothetical protein [Amycolatopsis sp.]|uniref:hypothetical protein n=1 Tax=Amycolatopsis sp. TaxID=37632 RepID=UPI002DFD8053|nr:hypothetical protein [Amycolatopsis sp.]